MGIALVKAGSVVSYEFPAAPPAATVNVADVRPAASMVENGTNSSRRRRTASVILTMPSPAAITSARLGLP